MFNTAGPSVSSLNFASSDCIINFSANNFSLTGGRLTKTIESMFDHLGRLVCVFSLEHFRHTSPSIVILEIF